MFQPISQHPDFPGLEKEVLKFWEDNEIFRKAAEKNEKGEPFVFFEGPPTANGRPGLHHIEARSYKDIILRFQAMLGKFIRRKAGWDTHGLPVELEVEKQLGISGKPQIENLVPGDKRASIQKFNELCRQSVWKYKSEWEKFTRRMGFWIDLEHPYATYDNSYIESVWWALKKISERGVAGQPLVYEGHKVLPYCTRCGTTLSSHEVAQGYKEVEETSVFIRFRMKETKIQFRRGDGAQEVIELDRPAYFLSWTTTPWTLPGNVALAVGEDIEYSVAVAGDVIYILASALVEKVLGKDAIILDRVRGTFLAGHSYEPLFEVPELESPRSYRVYTAPFVTTQDGTGIVHTAVMYGEDDYELGGKVGLPKFHTVGEDGAFIASLAELGGRYVKAPETEALIFKHLEKKHAVFAVKPYTHDYPFCWRCGTPLLYYARTSWFIRMSVLRQELMRHNEGINWTPAYIKDGRFGEWLSEVKDWAISRERYWGTPLPFWRCGSCKSVEIIGSIQELRERSSDPLPEDLELHRPFIDSWHFACKKCSGGVMERVPEVLDAWFDAGTMPYAQWHYPFENKDIFTTQFPADYISEAIDQTRGWFYTLLAVATALGEKQSPYKNVICLGHILDARGQKMSKSKGNVVDPIQLMDKYGSDIVRWYMYSVNQPGDPKRFTEGDVVRMQRRVQIILWNVYNYFITYANASGWEFTPQSEAELKNSLNVLDQWILIRLQQVVNIVTDSLSEYNVFRAARSLEEFVDDLSTWYVRRSRGRSDMNFFGTLYHTLRAIVKTLAPFMPFFSESLYGKIRMIDFPESVHLAEWPQRQELNVPETQILERMNEVRAVVEAVLAWRKSQDIKVRQPLSDMYVISASQDMLKYNFLFREELNFLNIHIVEGVPDSAGLIGLAGIAGKRPEVYINSTLTPELRAQGMARDIERQVQEMRKSSGLKVGERVMLYYETASPEVYESFEYFDQGKTYVSRVIGARQSVDHEQEIQMAGVKVWIGLKKVS